MSGALATQGAPRLSLVTPIVPVEDQYRAGACNIGPWEIRRRRAFAVTGFVAATALAVLLVAVGAPQWARLLVFLPLVGGTFSWLQARRRFCAGYAVQRRSNFGDGFETLQTVTDDEAHAADLRAVRRMARDAVLLAIVPVAILVLLPI